MKSITIHNMDNALTVAIRRRANQDGTSLNKTIKRLLSVAVGIKGKGSPAEGDFRKFCGVWNDKEADEFATRSKGFERVDSADWE